MSYTWSKAIDDSSSALSGASFANALSGLPTFDLRLDRSIADFDLRNVFTANAVAPLPNFRRGGPYTAALRGWSLNNIFNIRSGIPFTPVVAGDPLGLQSTATFQYPDKIKPGACTRPHQIFYIDTSCFAFPTQSAYGNGLTGPRIGTSRRNVLTGPGLFLWTAGVMKDQPITERVRAQFQAQAFNVTNHTNFANPATAASQLFTATGTASPTAGQLTSTAAFARQFQFALKVLF